MTEGQAKKIATKIVANILDEGLADSTFRDLYPEAYTEILRYRADFIREAEKVLSSKNLVAF